ncbi:MAG: hypothetical protein ACO3RU_13625 [Planctomycetota bacterium]
MTIRVRSRTRPGDTTKDIDLGPHAGTVEQLPYRVMRLPIDEAIVYSATKGHPIRVSR